MMNRFSKLAAVLSVLAASAAFAVGPNASSTPLTVQNAASNSGACTALSCAQMALQVVSGTVFTPTWAVQNTVGVNVAGTFSGTITFQQSLDEGATWSGLACSPINTGTAGQPAAVLTTTATGNWVCDVGGTTTFRAVMSTYTSGTATVILEAYQATALDQVSALPANATDPSGALLVGRPTRVSYGASLTIAAGTAAAAQAAVEADGTNILYLRKVKICGLTASQTTAATRQFVIYPTTAASIGGSTVTPVPLDGRDGAFGGVVRLTALVSTPAIGSVTTATAIYSLTLLVSAAATTESCVETPDFGSLGLKVPASASKAISKGFAVGDLSGGSGGTGNIQVDILFDVEAT